MLIMCVAGRWRHDTMKRRCMQVSYSGIPRPQILLSQLLTLTMACHRACTRRTHNPCSRHPVLTAFYVRALLFLPLRTGTQRLLTTPALTSISLLINFNDPGRGKGGGGGAVHGTKKGASLSCVPI